MDRVIDETLSARDGHLFVDDVDTSELAASFGTPLYVMSETRLRSNARRYRSAFQAEWPHGDVHVLPSLKANFALALAHVLADEGLGCDVFGASEFTIAMRGGFAPELVSLNGSMKDQPLIDTAVAAGARITLDAEAELGRVIDAARRLGRTAKVRLRGRPDYEGMDLPTDFVDAQLAMSEASRRYKAGIPTADLLEMGRQALGMPEVELTGVMAHMPRHRTELDVWKAFAERFADLVALAADAWDGWRPRELDIGGGLPSRRDPTGKLIERIADEDRPPTPAVEDYAAAIAPALAERLRERGIDVAGVALEVEPGRGLFADAGIHLTAVRNVKHEREPVPWTWVETDTSEMFLLDSLVEHNLWTCLPATRLDDPVDGAVDVVGRSCGFDLIVPDAALPAMQEGDLLAFLDTGAYQDASATNFNAMPRPATVMVQGATAAVIKRAETVEDVLARDVAPGRPAAAAAVRVKGIDHIGITVANIERSKRFYGELLGLALRAEGDDGPSDTLDRIIGMPGVRLRFAEYHVGRGQILELLQYVTPAGTPLEQRTANPGSAHLALEVDDVDAAYDRLIAAGVTVRSAPTLIEDDGDWHGFRCCYTLDPDGFTVEVLQRPGDA
jgi:diaminopimelate decarboxylase